MKGKVKIGRKCGAHIRKDQKEHFSSGQKSEPRAPRLKFWCVCKKSDYSEIL